MAQLPHEHIRDGRPGFSGGNFGDHSRGDKENIQRSTRKHRDRPKRKFKLPGCDSWVLVTTRLGRRFVHNIETKESLWKAPSDVEKAVIQYDLRERRHKARREQGAPSDTEDEVQKQASAKPEANVPGDEEESEYEEVEVTDSEAEQEDTANGDERSKRQRTEENAPEGPIEFGEDDIAYQLQAMEEDYDLDPGEFGGADSDAEGEQAGLALTEIEQDAAFRSLLDDHEISPYGVWEKIVDDSPILDDERYTMLPNMKARKKCFTEWAKDTVEKNREKKRVADRVDPKEVFLEFLRANASPKLYWPEFRRKFRKDPIMNDRKLGDRDREKMYRDFAKELKK